MIVEYDGNNSGGGDWLNDEDRSRLEAGGWRVLKGGYTTKALRQGKRMNEIIEEFEKLANQNVRDEGCNCCGPPHTFLVWRDQNDIDAVEVKKLDFGGEFFSPPKDWPSYDYITPSDYTERTPIPFDF